MITNYKYEDKIYSDIYSLSEALGKEGIFIPLSISEEDLTALNVSVIKEKESLDVIKARKIYRLKDERDKKEVKPIEYKGHSFDYDDKARDRISAAIIALEVAGASALLTWTTADNQDVKVTASDLRGIIAQVALRSDELHTAYRAAKTKVEQATTVDEVEAINLF